MATLPRGGSAFGYADVQPRPNFEIYGPQAPQGPITPDMTPQYD
jgi:hypothetical protein